MLDLQDMYEADAAYQFIQGLKYQARLQVLLKDPTSLPAAYNAAEAFEAAHERALGVRDPATRTPAFETADLGNSDDDYRGDGPAPV